MGTISRYIITAFFLALPILLCYRTFVTVTFSAISVSVQEKVSRGNEVSLPFVAARHQESTRPTTIVVQLINQLGNNLAGIATGRGLQLWAQKECGFDTELVLRYSEVSRKLKDTTIEVHRCFPNLRQFNFSQGNTPEYDQSLLRQKEMLGDLHENALHVKRTDTLDIERSLLSLNNVRRWTNFTNAKHGDSPNISFPFLVVEAFSMFDVLVDKYYDEFRRLFDFDEGACCKLKPDPDESVFHFRNYVTEMPRRGKKLGFEELSPNKTAFELFGNLQAGDKVAITSRYDTHPSVQPYVDALTRRGIKVRVITGQSGVEDLCFLMHAQKELVGIAESTYATWAAHLGNAQKVRLYSIDSPSRRINPGFSQRLFFHFNWTNPKLRRKVTFELYLAEESYP